MYKKSYLIDSNIYRVLSSPKFNILKNVLAYVQKNHKIIPTIHALVTRSKM